MAVPEYIQEQVLAEATSATPNYSIDPNDPRLTAVTNRADDMKLEQEQMYDNMIEGSDDFYNKQIDAVNKWGDEQAQLQQERTDFIIEQQEQLKEQEHKDYLKEQSGAYVDWQKQSNPYGVESEKMAASGLGRTGYSESSQVSFYNTYQNRVATARETYKRAILNYDNAIKDAMLQNNAALAEIAFNTLQQAMELSIAGFQYRNDLLLAKSDRLFEIEQVAHNQYMDILGQINTENAMKENVRQFGLTHAETVRSNRVQEDYNNRVLDETMRSNRAEEDYRNRSLDETIRSNKAGEAEANRHNRAVETHNQNVLNETIRSNKVAEKQAANNYTANRYSAPKTTSSNSKKITGGSNKITSNKSNNTVNTKAAVQGAKQAVSFTGSSYKEAVAFMKKMGVPSSRASAAMTESEWSRRKNANSSAAEVKGYKSYTAYIRDYVSYCIEEYSK